MIDYDELQRNFRRCFRLDEVKRQRQFFWWNDLLQSACTKSKDIIAKKLYHGVSQDLTLSTFSGTYYGMMSTYILIIFVLFQQKMQIM